MARVIQLRPHPPAPPELYIAHVPMTEEQYRAAVAALAELLRWAWEDRQRRRTHIDRDGAGRPHRSGAAASDQDRRLEAA